ncbi:MAG: hypothetical protein AABY15_08155 [Nanoarchaeota archaeon]
MENTLTRECIKGTVNDMQIIYNSGFEACRIEIVLDVNGKKIAVTEEHPERYGAKSVEDIKNTFKQGTPLELLVGRRFKLFNSRIYQWHNSFLGGIGFNIRGHTYYYSHMVYASKI